jgi:hypothetical protein
MILFPFAEYWWFYVAFTGGLLVLLAVDLGVFHRKAHEVSSRQAIGLSLAVTPRGQPGRSLPPGRASAGAG